VIKQTPIYDSGVRRSKAIEELIEAYRYRHLIFQLVRRDVLTRYKRSVLGVAWTMLNPLGMMLVFSIAFSQIFSSVRAYPAYILSGLVGWTFFSQVTAAAMNQMVWGGSLLNRIYVPRTTFVLSSIGTGLVNLFLSLIPLIIVVLVTGVPIHLSALFVIVAALFTALFALGISLLLSTWAVYFPDVAEMYQIVLTAWMYLTPIIYPENIVPETTQNIIFRFNPMYYLVKIFRTPLYEGTLPEWNVIVIAGGLSILSAAAGWIIFTKKADEFAYRV
jgi:ABC-type polysaccharide/polyol phosphate export permease